ncbi:hypothetical protein Emed_002010 [Eimeria media]
MVLLHGDLDSKELADMPLKLPAMEVIRRFKDAGPMPTKEKAAKLIDECFFSGFPDVCMWMPLDLPTGDNASSSVAFDKRQPETGAFDLGLSGTEVACDDSVYTTLHAEYIFAQNLIGIWPSLGRTTDFTRSTSSFPNETCCSEIRTTLLELPHGFIVPGGRFRELYYWDAYWTIRGLLYSGMVSTARGMILNFANLIRKFGFIPNGTRTYYLSRSQPPVFSLMLAAYFAFTGDFKLIRDTYLDVEREYSSWIDDCERQTSVFVEGEECHLQRYVGHQSTPRAEGWKEDVLAADFVRRKALESNCENPEEACASVFRNIRATAESGWDFSSRYVPDDVDLAEGGVTPHLKTESILPVDLNRFDFDTTQGRQTRRVTAAGVASLLMQLHLPVSSKHLCRRFGCERSSSKSGAAPCSCDDKAAADCAMESKAHKLQLLTIRFLVEKSGLWNTWGLSTSLLQTGQQWDGSNCWPPLLQMTVEAIILEDSSAVEAAYKRMGALPEKSSSLLLGFCGGGGEYECQKGFGWSIGVALELLFLKRVDFSYKEMKRLQREFGSAASCQSVDSNHFT